MLFKVALSSLLLSLALTSLHFHSLARSSVFECRFIIVQSNWLPNHWLRDIVEV